MVPIFGKKFKRTMAFILIFMMVFSTPTMALGSDLDLGGIDQGDNLGGDNPGGDNPGGGDDDVIGDDDDDVIGDDDDDVIGDDDDDVIGDDDDDVIGDDDDDVIGDDDDDVIGDDDDVIGEEEEETLLGPVTFAFMMVQQQVPLVEESFSGKDGGVSWVGDICDKDDIVGDKIPNNNVGHKKTIAQGIDLYVIENPNDKNTLWVIYAEDTPEKPLEKGTFTLYYNTAEKYYKVIVNVAESGEYVIGRGGGHEYSVNMVWLGSFTPASTPKGSITINKTVVDTTGTFVGGTFTFEVRKGDKVVDTVMIDVGTTLSNSGTTTVPLEYGAYTISEKDSDEDDFPYEVEIDNDGVVNLNGPTATVTVTNTLPEPPEPGKGLLTIKKTVEGLKKGTYYYYFTVNGKELDKPVKVVVNKDGATSSGSLTIQLPEGQYTVAEVLDGRDGARKDGYDLTVKVDGVEGYNKTVTVDEYTGHGHHGGGKDRGTNKGTIVNFTNAYKPITGSITITKKVEGLTGLKKDTKITYTFYVDGVEYKIPVTVGKNGSGQASIPVTGLSLGNHTVKENMIAAQQDNHLLTVTTGDKGKAKYDDTTGVTVKVEKGNNKEVKFTNTYEPSGALTIKKVVKGEDNPEGIFWFKVTGSNNYNKVFSIDMREGNSLTIDLLYGSYKVTEVADKNGKALDKDFGYTVSISNDGKVTLDKDHKKSATVTVTNTAKPDTGKLIIEKKIVGEKGKSVDVKVDTTFWFRVTNTENNKTEDVSVTVKEGKSQGKFEGLFSFGKYTVVELDGENGKPVNVNGTFTINGHNYQLASISDGEAEVKQGQKATVTIKNKYAGEEKKYGSLTITKQIVDSSSTTIADKVFSFKIYNEAEEQVGGVYKVTTKDGTGIGSYTVPNMEYGNYTVKELDDNNSEFTSGTITVGGVSYTVGIDYPGENSYVTIGATMSTVTVTNTPDQGEEPETIRLSVEKEWRGGTEAGIPLSVTFYLTINRERTEHSLTLTAEDDWFGTFEGEFPVKDDNGNVIEYGVYEVPVANYVRSDENAPNDDNVFEVVNTYQQPGATSGTLYLVKRLAGSWTANDTFRFLVEGPNGYSNIFDVATVNGTGSITLSNLAFGAYTVTEVGAANGSLTQNGVTYDVAVSANGQTTLSEQGQTAATITVTNTVTGGGGGGGGSTGRDRDETTGGTTDPLTDIDGVNVPLGTYNDSSIPEPNETEEVDEVDEVDELEEIEDPNVPLSNMPKTGVSDYLTLWLLGLCASLGLVAVLLRSKRKQEQE